MGNEQVKPSRTSKSRHKDDWSDNDSEDDHRAKSRSRKSSRNTKSRSKKSASEEAPDAPFPLIDSVCSQFPIFSNLRSNSSSLKGLSGSFGTYSDEYDDFSEDSRNNTKQRKRRPILESESDERRFHDDESIEEDEDNKSIASSAVSSEAIPPSVGLMSKPLASSFAKRCYFTKVGIGKNTQHYEGLTLTGNVVLMLASAMKLNGCPTICDEDLRRVEQTYPNQFSRLPDELLLSSGWRRISKYCHFSNKPVPDGIPFFHSKERCHTQGGYYFLLATAVGMIRPSDVEPLSRDNLVVLETDYAAQCDAAPPKLIDDPNSWVLVEKFCFFSGGPINTDEDVYYEADFDGNDIFMLAFLSPSLTPEELYRLGDDEEEEFLKSVKAVEEVESVYDLTERDFDDLKLYHLGPCRALPQYILQPSAWKKDLPPHFKAAREKALEMAREHEEKHPPVHEPKCSPASMQKTEESQFDNYDEVPIVEEQQNTPAAMDYSSPFVDWQNQEPLPAQPNHAQTAAEEYFQSISNNANLFGNAPQTSPSPPDQQSNPYYIPNTVPNHFVPDAHTSNPFSQLEATRSPINSPDTSSSPTAFSFFDPEVGIEKLADPTPVPSFPQFVNPSTIPAHSATDTTPQRPVYSGFLSENPLPYGEVEQAPVNEKTTIAKELQREIVEEGAFGPDINDQPMDEAIATRMVSMNMNGRPQESLPISSEITLLAPKDDSLKIEIDMNKVTEEVDEPARIVITPKNLSSVKNIPEDEEEIIGLLGISPGGKVGVEDMPEEIETEYTSLEENNFSGEEPLLDSPDGQYGSSQFESLEDESEPKQFAFEAFDEKINEELLKTEALSREKFDTNHFTTFKPSKEGFGQGQHSSDSRSDESEPKQFTAFEVFNTKIDDEDHIHSSPRDEFKEKEFLPFESLNEEQEKKHQTESSPHDGLSRNHFSTFEQSNEECNEKLQIKSSSHDGFRKHFSTFESSKEEYNQKHQMESSSHDGLSRKHFSTFESSVDNNDETHQIASSSNDGLSRKYFSKYESSNKEYNENHQVESPPKDGIVRKHFSAYESSNEDNQNHLVESPPNNGLSRKHFSTFESCDEDNENHQLESSSNDGLSRKHFSTFESPDEKYEKNHQAESYPSDRSSRKMFSTFESSNKEYDENHESNCQRLPEEKHDDSTLFEALESSHEEYDDVHSHSDDSELADRAYAPNESNNRLSVTSKKFDEGDASLEDSQVHQRRIIHEEEEYSEQDGDDFYDDFEQEISISHSQATDSHSEHTESHSSYPSQTAYSNHDNQYPDDFTSDEPSLLFDEYDEDTLGDTDMISPRQALVRSMEPDPEPSPRSNITFNTASPRSPSPTLSRVDSEFTPSGAGSVLTDYTPSRADSALSDYSPSQAMRGAQELIRRNRARRLAAQSNKTSKSMTYDNPEPSIKSNPAIKNSASSHIYSMHDDQQSYNDSYIKQDLITKRSTSVYPEEDDQPSYCHTYGEDTKTVQSEATWETHTDAGTEISGSVVSGSSVWADPATRNSRRALILQMAKARMAKKNSESSVVPSPSLSRTEKKVMEESTEQADDGNQLDFSGDLD